MYIDTHCHVNFTDFRDDHEEVINRALENDTWMILVGSKMTNNLRAIEMAKNYKKGVFAAVGVHPVHLREHKIYEKDPHSGEEINFTSKAEEFDIDEYYEMIVKSIKEVPVQRSFILNNAWGRIVAIGETGMDYYHLPEKISPMQREEYIDEQILIFRKHIKLADKVKLPLIIHCRGTKDDPYGAYDDLLKVLKEEKIKYPDGIQGVIHCFGGNFDQAKEFIKLGFYIGFTGNVTFDKTGRYDEMIKGLPLDRILIETDSPYLTPMPYRGKRNEPSYVKRVAEHIAKIANLTVYEIANVTSKNAMELFKLRY